ncbi:hypothetical protein [Ascidiimonas sp. W6]|uniref:hypothetical protein n=1 Tax=Ascidiimonas meishanensis TaxID=3128903 RepID=UPI0030EC9692
MSISKLIPNPYDKNSTLSDLEKKKILIKQGLSLKVPIKHIFLLIILGFYLIHYLKTPSIIVTVLIGTEIFINLIAIYIKIKALKSIKTINIQDDGKGYRNLLITNEYWEFIKSFFGVIANSISITIIFVFFSSEISNFAAQNPSLLFITKGAFKFIFFVFVIYRVFEFMTKLIRYYWISNLKESNNFAQINQEYILIEKKLKLIKFIPSVSIILWLVFLSGFPFWFSFIVGGFMLLMVLLSIIELKRIKSIQFHNKVIDSSNAIQGKTENYQIDPYNVHRKIENYQDEEIAGAVFGIIETATGFKDLFKARGVSILGKGKVKFSENSLLLTNYRLLLVQIPVPGGNKMIGETDYVSENFFFNRGEIRQLGEEMLKTNSITQFLKLTTNYLLYEEVKTVTLHQTKIIIEKLSGDKLGYFFMDKEYIEPLKELLQLYLKEKFINK